MAFILICTQVYWFECRTCHMRSCLQTRSRPGAAILCSPCGKKRMEEQHFERLFVGEIAPTQSDREGHWTIIYWNRRTVLDTT